MREANCLRVCWRRIAEKTEESFCRWIELLPECFAEAVLQIQESRMCDAETPQLGRMVCAEACLLGRFLCCWV
jgi:hypothetical protein